MEKNKNKNKKIVYCATVHLLVFGISPTSSGLTGLYFGLHKQSETGSVWSSVFTDTCSYKHTLIPHVVLYRPCFHSQRLGSNIYSWTLVCLQWICVDRMVYVCYILFNYIFKLKSVFVIANDKSCNAFYTYTQGLFCSNAIFDSLKNLVNRNM